MTASDHLDELLARKGRLEATACRETGFAERPPKPGDSHAVISRPTNVPTSNFTLCRRNSMTTAAIG